MANTWWLIYRLVCVPRVCNLCVFINYPIFNYIIPKTWLPKTYISDFEQKWKPYKYSL